MWRLIAKYFNRYPKRKKLAQKLFEYGLKVSDNKIYCGEIELSDSKLARALSIDRRIIFSTIKTITEKKDLNRVYSNLRPTCHLKNVAPEMNWGVIEIIPSDPSMPGIISNVTTLIADAKISIRQVVVDDFELSEEPRLYIIAEKKIPGTLISKISQSKGVKAVLIY